MEQYSLLDPFPKPEIRHTSLILIGIKTSAAQLLANYSIDQLLQKKVLGVTNLPVRRIAGFRSESLIVGFPDLHSNVQLLNTRHYDVEDDKKLF